MEDKYYIELKAKALKVEIYNKARDYAKDRNKVNAYFEMGELLSKAGKEYGKNIINNYSKKLMIEVGRKYNYRTLYRMRKFYEIFSNGKLTTLWSKLCWSHYREVLSLKNINEIIYYLNECENKNLSQRQLHELIKHNTYNRLNDETKNKLINKEKLMVEVGRKYKMSNLYKIRKFYEIFSNEKLYPLGTKLCWSHYRELLSVNKIIDMLLNIVLIIVLLLENMK